MLTSKKIHPKLRSIVPYYDRLRFETVETLEAEIFETPERVNKPPRNVDWKPIKAGELWGRSGITAWFRMVATPGSDHAGKRLFLSTELHCEAALFVNGIPQGVYTDDWTAENHCHEVVTHSANAGVPCEIAVEAYAGHDFPGTMPHDEPRIAEPKKTPEFRLTIEREDVTAFVFDLRVLLGLVDVLSEDSLRKWSVLKCLEEVWRIVPSLPLELAEEEWRPALATARKAMAPLLARKNGPTAPEIGLIAHSHLDTAWLWPIAETRRKCYRTFSSMVNLMERYPEVIFIQSSPVHAEMVKEDQPELFERMKKLIEDGRWEPNGGAWVEPDCNIPSGESLVRQFLYGIQFTREHFGYNPDIFWQPDVFGYSAALPQILKGFEIPYFCTTKMAWNDTTRFPYDTFLWRGMDGSEVLAHLAHLHFDPTPEQIADRWNWAQHKDSETKRLAAYGWGDGGGGPTAGSIELTRRIEDLEGLPKTRHTTTSAFMKELEEEGDWPLYVGELYLELHRGTLTSIAEIKRNNRRMEFLLRDAELISSIGWINGGEYPKGLLDELWKGLLINQFHDILPGTSIAEVNDEAHQSYRDLISKTEQLIVNSLKDYADNPPKQQVFNPLPWNRAGILQTEEKVASSESFQEYKNLDGENRYVVSVENADALSLNDIKAGQLTDADLVVKEMSQIENSALKIAFDDLGRIRSLRLKNNHGGFREVVPEGAVLNTFYCGEDVPEIWDSWDIDADQEFKMEEQRELISREMVSSSPLQIRIRSHWRIAKKSELWQDLIVNAQSPIVEFETKVNWQEKHMLLKAGFLVDVMSEQARFEVQFGHVQRPTHRNYLQDRARFEVSCQKWVDLSDEGFGVAILNDSKYGVSVHGNDIRLSLLKSGTNPDARADNGVHYFRYAVLPHDNAFSVNSVVKPAYEFNNPLRLVSGHKNFGFPLAVISESVILESVKRLENGDALILRLYEAGRKRSRVDIHHRGEAFGPPMKSAAFVNLMEEKPDDIQMEENQSTISFEMKPFEIRTLRIKFA